MFYAVHLCGNPNHKRYQRPIGFIVEGDEEIPLERKTEEENKEALNFDINKISELGNIVKTYIDEIGYDFTEDELDRIKRIKERNRRENE